jgi:hypothetical protein
MKVKEALHHLLNNEKGEVIWGNAEVLKQTGVGQGSAALNSQPILTGDLSIKAGVIYTNENGHSITKEEYDQTYGARGKVEVISTVNAAPGLKYDQEKPDLSLLPRDFLDEVAKAMQYGERKYGRYNYRGGMSWHRIVAAAMRHITAWNDGEDTDKESGVSHLGHAGACILMLCVLVKNKKGEDTRCKS